MSEQNQATRTARKADAAAVLLDQAHPKLGVQKLETGIPGFDHVSMGGLPRGRATVVAGQAGSAKTVFAAHFLAEGVRRGQPGVFVSMEEPSSDLRANLTTLGWDLAAWEAASDWRFVDASPVLREDGSTEPYSFAALEAQIGHAIDATGADRLVIDSLSSVFALTDDGGAARQRLRQLISRLRSAGLTVVMTVETATDPSAALSRYGIEEFVADNVVLLGNARAGKGRRRTLEVLKMRGSTHCKGEYAFTVQPGIGVVVLPVATSAMAAGRDRQRVTSGVPDLDDLLQGGLLRDSITLVTGPVGVGKTLLSLEFLASVAKQGERTLFLGYEESSEQIGRNAVGLARSFDDLRAEGTLRVVSTYPEEASLEDHLLDLKQLVDEYQPVRVVLDSLTALERSGSPEAYREFVVGLTSYAKSNDITMFLTASTGYQQGSTPLTEAHVSTLADNVLTLRYVEEPGRMHRAITVLKTRGSGHDLRVREMLISDEGISIGEPLHLLAGIVSE